MSAVVLDASAVLALMQAEPGAAEVAAVLPGAALGMVNLAEIIGKLCDHGMTAALAREAVFSLGIKLAAFTDMQAMVVGALRPMTKSAGLSLGDRACLALAREQGAEVLTADGAWLRVAEAAGVTVRLIRRQSQAPVT